MNGEFDIDKLTENEKNALIEVAKGMKYIREKSGYGEIRILFQGTLILVEPKSQIKFKEDKDSIEIV